MLSQKRHKSTEDTNGLSRTLKYKIQGYFSPKWGGYSSVYIELFVSPLKSEQAAELRPPVTKKTA